MSIPRRIEYKCPKCGKKYQTTIFDSINTEYAANLAESIISGERFTSKCPRCGFISHLEYDVLYHDLPRSAMIFVVHENNPKYQEKVAAIRKGPVLPNMMTRIVSDMNELREKVSCLEAGRDDRIIELCKRFLAHQLIEQQPSFKIAHVFYTFSGKEELVFFYNEKGEEMGCYLDKQMYEVFSEAFATPLSQMDDSPYQIIDQRWAASFLKE